MKRVLVLAAAVVAGLSGCASPARFVEKTPDAGVIAIPANTDAWPTHYRREALARIAEHVGPDFEIVEEREYVTGEAVVHSQQTDRQAAVDPAAPNRPAERQTTSAMTTTRDTTEYRIAYRKRPGAAGGVPGQPNVVQTQYRGTGAAPGGVTPAGGLPAGPPVGAGGGVGPTSFRMSTFEVKKDCKV